MVTVTMGTREMEAPVRISVAEGMGVVEEEEGAEGEVMEGITATSQATAVMAMEMAMEMAMAVEGRNPVRMPVRPAPVRIHRAHLKPQDLSSNQPQRRFLQWPQLLP